MGKRPYGTGTIWATRRDMHGHHVRVHPRDDEALEVFHPFDDSGGGYLLKISRQEARLLARRINQCLDATVRR